jgi:CCR4-NOT complex subunit CAF16
MLAVAENWLRRELDEMRLERKKERAQGDHNKQGDVTDHTQGGYTSGRLQTDDERAEKARRQGRLSDMMGNSDVMDKVRRVGN